MSFGKVAGKPSVRTLDHIKVTFTSDYMWYLNCFGLPGPISIGVDSKLFPIAYFFKALPDDTLRF